MNRSARFLRPLLGGALCLLAVSAPRTTTAAEIEGVRFNDALRFEDVDLALHCTGLLRYKVIFRGYVAALYLARGSSEPRVLDDVPKRLELSYFWSIDGKDIANAGDEILARNVDANTFRRLQPQREQINALYKNVRPGDRYSLTYIPGRGTTLALNDEVRGVIPGAEFAAAYFKIWLGSQPIDEPLRDQLLSCRSSADARQ